MVSKPKGVLVVIPARYGSTRFPGKPLVPLKGKPLIQWVWEAASRSKKASDIVVATDDSRIASAVKQFGGNVVMTRADHPSGTDRMAEVARKRPASIYVNVQGDEPLLSAREIDSLIEGLKHEPMATLAHPIESKEELADPNAVKVIVNQLGNALYFSRSSIPFVRQPSKYKLHWRHIGIYAFRREALLQFVRWPQGMLEQAESLEQLRALENGMTIRVIPTKMRCIGVDTPADLRRVSRLLKGSL